VARFCEGVESFQTRKEKNLKSGKRHLQSVDGFKPFSVTCKENCSLSRERDERWKISIWLKKMLP
jgi:hypothetical protein